MPRTLIYLAPPAPYTRQAGCSTSSYTSPPAYTSPIIYACILDTTRLGSSFAPGSTLYYQVAASAALNASAVFSTPSHPGVGKSGVLLALLGGMGIVAGKAVIFFLISPPSPTDLGTSQNSVSTIEHVLANPEQLSAIVHVGDLAYADGDAAEWDTYGELFSASSMRPLSIPWMTGVGNHGNYATLHFTLFTARSASILSRAEWKDSSKRDFKAVRYWASSVVGKTGHKHCLS